MILQNVTIIWQFFLEQKAFFFFFFNDTATTEIYTLSLHDALPICFATGRPFPAASSFKRVSTGGNARQDRKSTRLNSSHSQISYAVFCLKKKKNVCDVASFTSCFISCDHVHIDIAYETNHHCVSSH